MMKFGSDIALTAGGGTVNLNPFDNAHRITGSATLSGNWVIQLDATYTATNWLVFYFLWDATITLGSNTVTIFGQTLTAEQAAGKNLIIAAYSGSAWVVKVFQDAAVKPTGIGGVTTETLTNGGGTINLDPSLSANTLVLDGSPTLTSSWTIQPTGTPKAGDMFIVYYNATATIGADNITIFGKTLTASQALKGLSVIISTHDGSGWNTVILDSDATQLWEAGTGTESCQRINATTGCDASGDYAVAEGQNTTASGDKSHSEGGTTEASGEASHAEGALTLASGKFSHSEGEQTEASGDCSHAEGYETVASGEAAHSEGYQTEASGDYTHAEGYETYAKGDYSGASGIHSIAHIPASQAFASDNFNIIGDSQELKFMLKIATTNAVADNMQLADGTDGVVIPTDCVMLVDLYITSIQTGGVAGTIGDCMGMWIKVVVRNIAGTVSIVSATAATEVNVWDVTGDVITLNPSAETLACTYVPTVSGTSVNIVVTGEANKNIQHNCLWHCVINGFRNYSI